MGTFCTSAVFYEPKTTLKYKVNFKNPSNLASLPQLLKVLYYLPVLPKLLGSLCTASSPLQLHLLSRAPVFQPHWFLHSPSKGSFLFA